MIDVKHSLLYCSRYYFVMTRYELICNMPVLLQLYLQLTHIKKGYRNWLENSATEYNFLNTQIDIFLDTIA